MKRVYGLIIWSILIIAAVACSDKHDSYSFFQNIDTECWAYGDTISFSPEDMTAIRDRAISVAIRHNNSYPYRNIWLEVTFDNGGQLYSDTMDIELADIYGRWHSNGIGPSYQIERRIDPKTRITDDTKIGVRHIMRTDTLRGVEQVGVIVYPANTQQQ